MGVDSGAGARQSLCVTGGEFWLICRIEATGAPASEGLGRTDERLIQGKPSVNVSGRYF